MALFKISQGSSSALNNQALTEGYCWFTPDDGKFYIDAKKNNVLTRIPLNAAVADSVAWANVSGKPGNSNSSATGFMTSDQYTKLAGIATGAQVNVLENVTASGTAPLTLTASSVSNKSITISGSIADASTSAKGVVKIGDGISVNNGTISVTASSLGLSSAMLFKGSLGTGGTITSLPTAVAGNSGYTYKVITAGTYASQVAKVGDVFVSDGSSWILIPSGDEPSGTVTSVGISNATNGGLTVTSSPITTSGTISIGHSNVLTNAQTTQALYPIKIDKNGHISAYGTAVTSLPASDVSAWAKAATKPSYALSEITGADDVKAIEALTGTTGILKKTAANTWTLDTTAYTTNTGTVTKVTAGAGLNTSADQTDSATKGSITATGTLYLTTSGVTAGSYGPSANATPAYGVTFNVPYITVDAYGRVTAASTKTVKIPASDNTDTKQYVTRATTTKAYITGVATTPTSIAQALTGVADTGVYLTTTAGEISAVRHSFNVSDTEKAYMMFNSTTNAIDFIFN